MKRLPGKTTMAAAFALGAILTVSAAAAPIYTCGFEPSEGFTVGNLHGQEGWYARTDTPSTVVQTDEVYEGQQAVQATVSGLGESGYIYQKLGTSTLATSDTEITVSQRIKIKELDAAAWAVVLSDDAGDDSAALLFHSNGGIYIETYDSFDQSWSWVYAADWQADVWHELTIALDYSSATFEVYVDEGAIAVNQAITGTGRLAELRILGEDYVENASLYYDNLVVSGPAGPGDANNDGAVDNRDASILGAHWLQTTGAEWEDGDFNGDHAVDDQDAAILAAHWNPAPAEQDAPAPEPSTLVLLLGAAAAWLARRPARARR